MGDSGDKSTIRVFRWFWDFLKEEKVLLAVYLLKRFILICFSKCNLHFQSVLICLDLNGEVSLKCPMRNSSFTEIQLFKVEYF